jgi:hypothetical protein
MNPRRGMTRTLSMGTTIGFNVMTPTELRS